MAMKSRPRLLAHIALLAVALASTFAAGAQAIDPGATTGPTVAPLGTRASIPDTDPGQVRYIDERPEPTTLIDAPPVELDFEFSATSATEGTARLIAAPRVPLAAPALDVVVDGQAEVALSEAFTRSARRASAYRSVAPGAAYHLPEVGASPGNALVLDVPVTLTGERAVLSFSLNARGGEGEAASLFLLGANGRIYAGVQGFFFLEQAALRDELEAEGVEPDEIERRLKERRSEPGKVEVEIQPPPPGHADTDPNNSIVVNGQIQFTDINGNTFPVQDADVEVYDVNGASETLMDSGSTDSNGDYSITVSGVDTAGDATGPDILVRAYPRGSLVRVHMADGGAVYTMDSPVQNDVADDSTVTINLTAGNDESTNPGQVAFEAYEANRYFGAFITSVNGSAPDQILVEYPRSGAGDTSFYTDRLNLALSDGHDWDNIQHEYGHHVQSVFDLANNPGGTHSSADNACVERPTKDEALRLAWAESWPTAYSIIAQNEQNLGTLGIPNLGDTSYTDTKPAGPDFGYDIETGTTAQTGEATERALMRVLWDVYDNTDDGADSGVSYSAQSLWDAAIASTPEIFSAFWAQFVGLLNEAAKMDQGPILTREGLGADLTAPADPTTYSGGAAPTFSWSPNLPCDSGGNGRFSVHFQHQGTGALLYASPFQSGTSFTPSADQLDQIFVAAGGNLLWSVLTRDLTAPQTGDYYSEIRTVVDDFDVPDRDPVDIVLVLDLSDSMNSPPPDGDIPKIDVLQQAVELFINTWNVHSIADDRLGLIYFNDNVSSITGTPPDPVLKDVAANAADYVADVNGRSGSGCTAIGGALQEAFDSFDDPARPKHVLLFSDGIQNVNPFVGRNGDGELQIMAFSTSETDLPFGGFFCNTDTAEGLDGADITPDGEALADKDITIHSIGVGVNGADFEDLIEQASGETGGEHHFTSIPDAELDIFFTNDLVESLKQNTLQVVKTESDVLGPGQRQVISVPVGPSAHELTLAVSWKHGASSPLSVRVTPPGAAIPVTRDITGGGHRVIHFDLPIDVGGMNSQGSGNWQVALVSGVQEPLPYQFSGIVDEGCFKFDMLRPPGGLRAGDPVPVAVRLGVGGAPLTGAEDVTLDVTRPARARGPLLAEWLQSRRQQLEVSRLDEKALARLSEAQAAVSSLPSAPEHSPYMINKLEALAFSDPAFAAAARETETQTVQLFDSGLAEHGDDIKGDGIYSKLVDGATVPGHYTLAFGYQATNTCGRVTREESSSFLLRLGAIDPNGSVLDIGTAAGGEVAVSVTPADRFGNIQGPGYADQIRIEYGTSRPSGPVVDNLDGSYTQAFTDIGGQQDVVVTVRGEPVTFLGTAPPETTAWLCWLALALLLLALVLFVVFVAAAIRGKSGALAGALISAIIAIVLAYYVFTQCW
jgi:hypothetical protein